LASYLETAIDIARESGALLATYFEKRVAFELKGDFDLVTEADRASEKLIGERLLAAFPEHGIYGEEGTRDRLDSEYRWYIDPLDGTTNFAHQFPAFCVSMGLERRAPGLPVNQDGEMVAGVIYDPLRDEMFSAEAGRGAWLNGRRIHVSKTKALAESLTEWLKVLAKAGVTFAFYSDGVEGRANIFRAVKKAIDNGLPFDAALKAMTLTPAEIFGVSNRLGSIEKGKIANIIVTNPSGGLSYEMLGQAIINNALGGGINMTAMCAINPLVAANGPGPHRMIRSLPLAVL